MKNPIFLYATTAVLCLASCSGSSTQQAEQPTLGAVVTDRPKTDSVLVDSAKGLINDANKWVEKGMRNNLPVEKVNNELRPIMTHYRDLLKRMSPSDTLLVHEYRIDEVNKLINLQIELETKKK